MAYQKESRINTVMETTLKNLSTYIDVKSAVGTPITTKDGDLIIPLSKVTFGLLAGGGEYGKTNIFKKGEDLPFSAGNGAIVSLKPCGFLIKNYPDINSQDRKNYCIELVKTTVAKTAEIIMRELN